MTVTVYGTPNCVQCNATYRKLDRGELDYTKVDLTQHPETAEAFRNAGYYQAPIVEYPGGRHSGYRPDILDGLIAQMGRK